MAEMERLANHFGDFGAICSDGGLPLLNAYGAVLRERVLRLAASCFGHRLLMDRIIPGGVAIDIAEGGAAAITRETAVLRDQFERLVEVYENTASLQDRVVGTGRLDPAIARRLGCGGYAAARRHRISTPATTWPMRLMTLYSSVCHVMIQETLIRACACAWKKSARVPR